MSWLDTRPQDVVDEAIVEVSAAHGPSADALRSYADGDLRFALWMHLVDKRCATVVGLGVFDLEDWNWRDAYDAGSSPKEALADFLEEHDYYRDE